MHKLSTSRTASLKDPFSLVLNNISIETSIQSCSTICTYFIQILYRIGIISSLFQLLGATEPSTSDWKQLKKAVEGRLIETSSPFASCAEEGCQDLWKTLNNPFLIQEQPWGTQSTGWLNAWTSTPSSHVVVAEKVEDIIAAVNFARDHKLKLVIKGAGHDYLGRSNAPNSLLIWTHRMREIQVHDAFIPLGAPSKTNGVHAVSAQAGARWIEAYDAVTNKQQRYVQGGGCTTVGVAGGFLQGGGFGSFSRKYGIAAGSLLEAEVVTANGEVLVANAYQNKDLFWALKGGGGGTFGVVTRVTLETHELPQYFGVVRGKIKAASEPAYQELIETFIHFYRDYLFNETWGEQASFKPNNELELTFLFLGISKKEAEETWNSFLQWIKNHPEKYQSELSFIDFPPQKFWDISYMSEHAPDLVVPYQGNLYFWTPNKGEVSAFWYAYQSRWLPASYFENDRAGELAKILYDASREWAIALHFNKGLAGCSKEARERTLNTSINPNVLKSAALVIASSRDQFIFPGVKGHEPDRQKGEISNKRIKAAMEMIAKAVPDLGAYSNEADYFQENWKTAFWGEYYPKLLQIKRRYDPENLFQTHHSVGSEELHGTDGT